MKALLVGSAVLSYSPPDVARLPAPAQYSSPAESEGRNNRFQNQSVTAKVCINSADFDPFLSAASIAADSQHELYARRDQTHAGRPYLRDARQGTQTVISFRFSKDTGTVLFVASLPQGIVRSRSA